MKSLKRTLGAATVLLSLGILPQAGADQVQYHCDGNTLCCGTTPPAGDLIKYHRYQLGGNTPSMEDMVQGTKRYGPVTRVVAVHMCYRHPARVQPRHYHRRHCHCHYDRHYHKGYYHKHRSTYHRQTNMNQLQNPQEQKSQTY